ncbi:hypothetical protein BCR43DRAFT_521412 [Syncephalastrum racemosum]|uniref:C2H2-type domain-containing protein n=1 Tax=Syncephalastrum racemosum TaxID=13706 RepID=A0A1X2HLZ9_SYNRA|nr:hypothetical protein BCR43DRAFT_521412 [Syncephalastrum racemosum]
MPTNDHDLPAVVADQDFGNLFDPNFTLPGLELPSTLSEHESACSTPGPFEMTFESKFECCGIQLMDLAQLSEHYETSHLCHDQTILTSGPPDHHVGPMTIATDAVTSLMEPVAPPTTPVAESNVPLPADHTQHLLEQLLLHMAEEYYRDETAEMPEHHLSPPPLRPPHPSPYTHNTSSFPKQPPEVPQSKLDSIARPWKCEVPGCNKAYKNRNGLKYHTEHGHLPPDDDPNKRHRCPIETCLKAFKSAGGRDYHIAHCH